MTFILKVNNISTATKTRILQDPLTTLSQTLENTDHQITGVQNWRYPDISDHKVRPNSTHFQYVSDSNCEIIRNNTTGEPPR